jgi:hypothetical protein
MHNQHLILINSNYQSWNAQQASGFHFRRFINYGFVVYENENPAETKAAVVWQWIKVIVILLSPLLFIKIVAQTMGR